VLHLRIIAPTTVSPSVRAALLDEPGATHITRCRTGAAVEPEATSSRPTSRARPSTAGSTGSSRSTSTTPAG
jgi:hypothetical protein